MKLAELKCRNCGGELAILAPTKLECIYCQSKYTVSNLEDFTQPPDELGCDYFYTPGSNNYFVSFGW